VLLFTAAAGTLTGILFGLIPAWRSSRVSPNAAMKAQDASVRWNIPDEARQALVVAQVALSMILVAGAGLMLTTFHNLSKVDPGFHTEGVLLAELDMRHGKVPRTQRADPARHLGKTSRASWSEVGQFVRPHARRTLRME